jgi:bifunctional non-homologous end joining protein LigD
VSTLEPVSPFEPASETEIPAGADWIHQVKWDGVRILVYRDDRGCRLFNRKGNERTGNYPELAAVESYCSASSVILDGEVIALGKDGKPSFHEVMRRDGIRRSDRVEAAVQTVPVAYMIFDLLYLDGEWLLKEPLFRRQERLEAVIRPGPHVQLVPSHEDGEALYALMKQQGMEGIVCKRRDSLYTLGGKDRRWVKVKNYGDLIAVVGGFTLNGGIVNAVLLGIYDGRGDLHYIGHAGTGRLTRKDWAEWTVRLQEIERPDNPFKNRHPEMKGSYWVIPKYTLKVQFAEWRWREGRTLRQPSIQAFVDIPPEQCVFDEWR